MILKKYLKRYSAMTNIVYIYIYAFEILLLYVRTIEQHSRTIADF